MNNVEKISTVLLLVLGFVLLVFSFLELFFYSFAINQNNLISMGYFVLFLLLSSKYKNIFKNKFLMITFYMVVVLRLIVFFLA